MTQVANPVSGPVSSSTFGAMIGAAPGAQSRPATPDSPEKAQQRADLEKAAKAFEAIFMRKLMGSMRQAGLGDELTGSSAVDQFRELSDAKMADNMADKGGLGIAQLLLSQLDKKP